MDKLKQYVIDQFEHIFVLVILVTTVAINYLVAAKLAFLSFYFLPVILAGYYLNRRKAVLGAILSVLFIGLYLVYDPVSFQTVSTQGDTFIHVAVWAGFLVLTGAVLGSLQERLQAEISETNKLNEELRQRQEELTQANTLLRTQSEDLESRVAKRTDELEQSREAIGQLKGKVEQALHKTMDPAVVNLMIEGQLRNEKRQVSVLFSDLVKFSEYSENLPPEVVIGELNRYLAAMEPILLTFHGHIDKYIGDGIMAEFGAPIDFATHHIQSVLAGLQLQERMLDADFPWQMRIGIASGSSITGLIGSCRQSYTAIGDMVNLASRLEQACIPGGVLVDWATYVEVSHLVDARRMRTIQESAFDVEQTAQKQHAVKELRAKVDSDPNRATGHFALGSLYLELGEFSNALTYLERAVRLAPDRNDFKLAFAEAGLAEKQSLGIKVKGKSHRVEAFQILGRKDPLDDRNAIPQEFYDKYANRGELTANPESILLPVEALDGSVGHGRKVSLISYALAEEMELEENDKLEVLNAGFLADVGKEVIPPHVLNRQGRLSQSEVECVQAHPAESVRFLQKNGYQSQAMVKIIESSHELFDGSGYPKGLKGEQIPIGSRIVAVADIYVELTSKRTYREAWDRKAALDDIASRVEKGHYDGRIVERLDLMMRH